MRCFLKRGGPSLTLGPPGSSSVPPPQPQCPLEGNRSLLSQQTQSRPAEPFRALISFIFHRRTWTVSFQRCGLISPWSLRGPWTPWRIWGGEACPAGIAGASGMRGAFRGAPGHGPGRGSHKEKMAAETRTEVNRTRTPGGRVLSRFFGRVFSATSNSPDFRHVLVLFTGLGMMQKSCFNQYL